MEQGGIMKVLKLLLLFNATLEEVVVMEVVQSPWDIIEDNVRSSRLTTEDDEDGPCGVVAESIIIYYSDTTAELQTYWYWVQSLLLRSIIIASCLGQWPIIIFL